MGRSARIAVVLGCMGAAVVLIVFAAMAFIRSSPPTVAFSSQNGKPVTLKIQTVGAIGFGVHPEWVSYLVQDPQGNWVHTTLWKLPAHRRVDVTIYQFDSGSPLRNQQLGSAYGVVSPKLNGQPFTLINSNLGNGVGHTFSVPELGINVPLPGVDDSAKNFCGSAPCALNGEHNLITFSFTTPGAGRYRWQCFVPCGAGWLYGNGGPMQTVGYMGGFLEVS